MPAKIDINKELDYLLFDLNKTAKKMAKNEPKMESVLPQVYYCKKCDRYTDVRFLSDKEGGRNKSYCYKCADEMLIPCSVKYIEKNANLHNKK